MNSSSNIFDLGIDRWSVDDRLRLIGEIWESLPPNVLGDVPESHRAVLEQRIAEAAANPASFLPWEVVRERLLGPQ